MGAGWVCGCLGHFRSQPRARYKRHSLSNSPPQSASWGGAEKAQTQSPLTSSQTARPIPPALRLTRPQVHRKSGTKLRPSSLWWLSTQNHSSLRLQRFSQSSSPNSPGRSSPYPLSSKDLPLSPPGHSPHLPSQARWRLALRGASLSIDCRSGVNLPPSTFLKLWLTDHRFGDHDPALPVTSRLTPRTAPLLTLFRAILGVYLQFGVLQRPLFSCLEIPAHPRAAPRFPTARPSEIRPRWTAWSAATISRSRWKAPPLGGATPHEMPRH